jgi:hypothetical protein
LADTLISLEFLPKLMPTELNLEDKIGIDKEIKEEDEAFVPQKSRFLTAFLRIALSNVSSSVAVEPSSATECLTLRLAPVAAAAGGGQILSTAAAGTPIDPGGARGDEAAPPKGTSMASEDGAAERTTEGTCSTGPANGEPSPTVGEGDATAGLDGPTAAGDRAVGGIGGLASPR